MRRALTAVAESSPPLPTTRNAILWPFASDSPWNTPIGSGAVLVDYPDARRGSPGINSQSWSCELSIHDSSAPLLTITQANECNVGSSFGGTPPQFNSQADYTGSPPTTCYRDGYANFLHTDGYIYGFHNFRRTSATTGLAAHYSGRKEFSHAITGSGWKMTHGWEGGSTWISGSVFIGGLMRKWELAEIAAGTRTIMNHPLQCVFSANLLKAQVNGVPESTWVWPACVSDSYGVGYTGTIPMGALLTIPPTFNVEAQSWSTPAKVVARTIQRYGVYVVGQGGSNSWILYAELHANQETVLNSVRNHLSSIMQQLRVVTNNGPNSVGGGGTYPADLWPPPNPILPEFD